MIMLKTANLLCFGLRYMAAFRFTESSLFFRQSRLPASYLTGQTPILDAIVDFMLTPHLLKVNINVKPSQWTGRGTGDVSLSHFYVSLTMPVIRKTWIASRLS